MSESMFVVSTFQQFKRIDFFIKKYEISNPAVIVIYTKANIEQIKLVKNFIRAEEILYPSLYIELPLSPNSLTIHKVPQIAKIYKSLLHDINPDSLYLLSFEKHYAILANMAKEMNIDVCLIEEGSATYKMLIKDFHIKNDKFKIELKNNYRKLTKDNLVLIE